MSYVHWLDCRLARLEKAAIVLLLCNLLLLGLLQIILRNLFASGLLWADELLRHTVLWLGFLGASIATRQQRHLRIDVLARLLPVWCQTWLALLTNLLAALGCLVLFQAAWAFVRDEYAAGSVLSFGIATWMAQSIVPLGLFIMALRFALRTSENLILLTQRETRS